MKHDRFWTLVQYGCQAQCKKGSNAHYAGTLCTPNLVCRSMERCLSRFLNPNVIPIPAQERSLCAERAAGVISEETPFHKIEISAAVRAIQGSVEEQIEKGQLNSVLIVILIGARRIPITITQMIYLVV